MSIYEYTNLKKSNGKNVYGGVYIKMKSHNCTSVHTCEIEQ